MPRKANITEVELVELSKQRTDDALLFVGTRDQLNDESRDAVVKILSTYPRWRDGNIGNYAPWRNMKRKFDAVAKDLASGNTDVTDDLKTVLYNMVATNAMFQAQGVGQIPEKVLPLKSIIGASPDLTWVFDMHKEVNEWMNNQTLTPDSNFARILARSADRAAATGPSTGNQSPIDDPKDNRAAKRQKRHHSQVDIKPDVPTDPSELLSQALERQKANRAPRQSRTDVPSASSTINTPMARSGAGVLAPPLNAYTPSSSSMSNFHPEQAMLRHHKSHDDDRERHEAETTKLRTEMAGLRSQITDRDNQLAELSHQLAERNNVLAERDSLLAERDSLLYILRVDMQREKEHKDRLTARLKKIRQGLDKIRYLAQTDDTTCGVTCMNQ